MKMKEISYKHDGNQIILSFSSNNDVLITKDCFEPESKFYRMSRNRLEEEFLLAGVMRGDDETFIATGDEDAVIDGDILVYRTYRGGGRNDYLICVYTGEYRFIEHNQKISYTAIIKKSNKSMFKDGKPTPDKVLDICPHIRGKHYFVAYRNNGLKEGIHYSGLYYNDKPHSYMGYLLGVLVSLHTAKKYAGLITKVRIFCPDDPYAKGIYMFPLKYWKPNNNYTKSYVEEINRYKDELQELGISICFMK